MHVRYLEPHKTAEPVGSSVGHHRRAYSDRGSGSPTADRVAGAQDQERVANAEHDADVDNDSVAHESFVEVALKESEGPGLDGDVLVSQLSHEGIDGLVNVV